MNFYYVNQLNDLIISINFTLDMSESLNSGGGKRFSFSQTYELSFETGPVIS
jgi:hypothetical protein